MAMTEEQIDHFLAPPRIALLATINRDGRPAQNPVWYEYEDGKFRMAISRDIYYGKNLMRDPRVSLCVQDEDPPYKGIVARGRATTEPDTEFGVMRRLAIRYFGEEQGKRYADSTWADHGQDLMLVTLVSEKIASWDYSERRDPARQA